MCAFCGSGISKPFGENKTPHVTGARGIQFLSLLSLTDFQDFNIICAARRLDFYGIAYLVAQDGFTDR